jgi:arsenate reductase (glutaredoxin)
MHYSQNELVLLYNSDNAKDRKTLAYALTVTTKINRQEINSVRISNTMFAMLLDKLDVDAKQLVNKADPYYQTYVRGKDLAAEDWYSILVNRPTLLRCPVALYRNRAILCETPSDVLKLVGSKTLA